MRRNVLESVLGLVVLVVAGAFVVFTLNTANLRAVEGYLIYAEFTSIGGLEKGDDVQISGVKIGTVRDVALNQQSYQARIEMSVAPHIELPKDTSALITSESLLGGKVLQLQPGASDRYLEPGDKIQITQAPQNLEQLLGRFIFNATDSENGGSGGGTN